MLRVTARHHLIGIALAALGCGGGGGSDSPTQPPPANTPPPATQLSFATQPSSANAGTALSPAVVVHALTASGALATGFTGAVTLSLGTNTGGGVLSGSTVAAAVAGIATFGNLTLDKAGAAYTLVASSTGLMSATSGPFTITAPPSPGTKLYLAPLLNFKLNTAPSTRTSSVEWCVSTADWVATLAGDMVGTAFEINLGVKTINQASGSGTLLARIIHKRGSTESVLATTNFTTSPTYAVKNYAATGSDPATVAGDQLILRVSIVTPSAALPCLVEWSGPGTDNYIVVPTTTITP